jgi:hypothetical protein
MANIIIPSKVAEVVMIDGVCYQFLQYTGEAATHEEPILLYDTCDDCTVEPTCNSCDPAIPNKLTVTLSGLGGDWDGYNGVHVVDWDNDCDWSKDLPLIAGQSNTLYLYWGGGKWNIGIDGFAIACIIYISQNGIADECDPYGTYSTLVTCADDAGGFDPDEECVDTDTCEKTTMVAVVS